MCHLALHFGHSQDIPRRAALDGRTVSIKGRLVADAPGRWPQLWRSGPLLTLWMGDRSVDVECVASGRAATLPPLREAVVRARWGRLIYARAYDLGH